MVAISTPIYKKIQQDIFELIVSGQLREGDRIASESEIAKQYYVSSITAKNALNALVDRGLAIRIKGKGTFVSASPFSVPVSQSKNIGVSIGAILPGMSTRIEQAYMLHLDEYCQNNGYSLLLRCSRESPELEREMLQHFVNEGVHGIILFPVVSESNPDTIRQIIEKKVPIVFLDRYLPNFDISWVTSDNKQGAALATEFLLNKTGDNVAILHFPISNNTVSDRLQGFKETFNRHGFSVDEHNICLIDDHNLLNKSNQDRIEHIMTTILTFLRENSHIRGLFATNAEIAQVAYYAISHLGFTPDTNFSLVSFDNPHLPGVHFIKQGCKKIVETGIDMLSVCIKGDSKVVHSKIPTSFVHVEKSPVLPGELSNLVMGLNP